MVISVIWLDVVLNPAWEKHKSGFAQPIPADFVFKHQRLATGATEAAAEAKKIVCEGVYGQSQSHATAAFSSQAGMHYFHSTEKGNSLDLRVPWAGQVYRLLQKIILSTSVCRSHCDSREKFHCWAVVLQSQPLPCEYRFLPV